MKKGFMQSFKELDADCFCLQETKLQPDQIELDLPGYYQYWNSAVKKGYSGTALFTKIKPLSVTYGIGMEEHDQEGRVITADFNDHCLVTCYTPNSQRGLARLTYRMKWEDDFKKYLLDLSKKKPVILCGDLNVAHEEIDLANPASNHMNAGFTDDERNKMTELLSDGFTDSFRYLHQDKKMPTPGGATLQNPGKEISGGELIISSSPIYCSRGLKRQKSILPFWAVTTARWNWILKSKIYLQDSNYLYHSERRNLNDECTHRGR